MEKTLAVILMIAFLCIGLIGGAVLFPLTNEVVVEKEVVKEVPVNVTVEKEIPVQAPDALSLAVDAFLTAVEDEEDEAGNEVDVVGSYDFDEIEVSRVYNEYTVNYDGDITTVNFRIKLRFDEDGEASEKETYDVEVIFEDNEDTEVTVD